MPGVVVTSEIKCVLLILLYHLYFLLCPIVKTQYDLVTISCISMISVGQCYQIQRRFSWPSGRGPRVVVSTAAFHARVRSSVPGLGGFKETKNVSSPSTCESQYCGWYRGSRDREVACSTLDRQGSNFESCVWRTVSFQSSHHPQEVLLAQFSLYVDKGGLKPDSFYFFSWPSLA